MAGAARIQIAYLFTFVLLFLNVCQTSPDEHYKNWLYLDPADKYYLAWTFDDNKIDFLVRVNTSGYVGFGISPGGDMKNSDFVIGGVNNGKHYFWDYHALQNGPPLRDDFKNWNLKSSQEINSQTTLTFWRNLVTGDKSYGNNITDNKMYVIWAFGETDQIIYHQRNRGSKSISLLQLQTTVEEPTTVTQPRTTDTPISTTDEATQNQEPGNGNSGASDCYWPSHGLSIVILAMFNIFT